MDEHGDVLVPDGSDAIPRRNVYAALADLRSEHPAEVASTNPNTAPDRNLSLEDRLDLSIVPPTAEELAYIAYRRSANGVQPLNDPKHLRADERRRIMMGRALEGTRLARDFTVPEVPASEPPEPPSDRLFDPAHPDREVN